ncbi:MAG: mycothiol system anti-sigma-R factor [Acidimicrobiia bacterium]|nr:mycothiol system anti-sigma-R factor [Acidimicrobiia bacterium]
MDDLDCTKALLALYEFLDGELTVENRQDIAGHLDGCPHCFSVFDFEAELRIVVRSRVRTQVPPELLTRIAETIEREAGASGPAGFGRASGPGAANLPPGVEPRRLGPKGPGMPGLPGT